MTEKKKVPDFGPYVIMIWLCDEQKTYYPAGPFGTQTEAEEFGNLMVKLANDVDIIANWEYSQEVTPVTASEATSGWSKDPKIFFLTMLGQSKIDQLRITKALKS